MNTLESELQKYLHILLQVDPNPDNLVGAGILHTKQGQVRIPFKSYIQ